MIESSEHKIGPITRALSARLIVLIVEPAKEGAEDIARELEHSGYTVSAEHVASGAEVGAALDKTSFDIVITHHDVSVLQALRERQLETPVIVMTDRKDDVTSLEAIAAGAEDVLKREDLYRLPYVVGRILQHAQIRQDQSAMLSTGKIYLNRKRRTVVLRIALLASLAALLIVEFVPGAILFKTLLTVSLGALAAIYLLTPIERLRKAAAQLSLGSLDLEVPKVPGALGDIATGLDTLRKRLKKSVLARQSDLAQRLRAEEALRQVHLRLKTQVDATQSRARQFTLLAEMGALLQACATREETQPIIERYTTELFPQMQAAVLLELSTADCWALRRGQSHIASAEAGKLRCAHAESATDTGTLCIPLMAQGAAIGILHLRHPDFAAIPQALGEAVAEQISLCLANLMLREELRDLAITDSLTGLYNRRFVAESLTREIQRAERLSSTIGLIAIDLDHFKRINDRFGHDGGDAALKAIAALLTQNVRGGDIACRLGGEEFAVILPGATAETTERRAEELRAAVQELRIPHANHELPQISISCGVALFPEHATTADALLKAGDLALYRAKEHGRNRVVTAAA